MKDALNTVFKITLFFLICYIAVVIPPFIAKRFYGARMNPERIEMKTEIINSSWSASNTREVISYFPEIEHNDRKWFRGKLVYKKKYKIVWEEDTYQNPNSPSNMKERIKITTNFEQKNQKFDHYILDNNHITNVKEISEEKAIILIQKWKKTNE